MILLRTAIKYVTASAHFHPGLVVQLGSASNWQVGYQISTGRPRLEHNHRQEGIPPSWSADPSVCVRQKYKLLQNVIIQRAFAPAFIYIYIYIHTPL